MFLLPTIVAFYVQNFVYVPSLSSPLLLRNYPNTFAFIPIPSMSLSSRNRSISKIFRHILPCIAPVCEGMHYHKTGVPWQMKSTLIMFLFLLVLPRNALLCEGFRGFVKCVILLASWQNRARWSRLLRAVSSKVGSKPDRVTTNSLFYPLLAAFFTIGNSSSQEPYLLSMLLDKHFITISTFESVS